MALALILLLFFAGRTQAADSHCDATQSDRVTTECSATLGASVYIQVLATAEGYRLRGSKQLPVGHVSVFSVKRDIVTVQETFRNRTDFFINNGTLKITGVERADAGEFSVEVYTSTDGMPVRTIHLKLDVKENILPIVVLACSALVLLLILVAASCCIYKKVKHNKKTAKQKTENKLWASI